MWTNPGNEVAWELSWHLVETNKILSDSFNKITINKAHSIVWFERRHHLVLAWLIHFGHYIPLGHHDFPNSWQTGEKRPTSHVHILRSPASWGGVKSKILSRYLTFSHSHTVFSLLESWIHCTSINSSGAHPPHPWATLGHLLTLSVTGVRHSKFYCGPGGLGISIPHGDPRVFDTCLFERRMSLSGWGLCQRLTCPSGTRKTCRCF